MECIVIISLAIISLIDNTMKLQELNRSSLAANDDELYGLIDNDIENERQCISQSQERSIIKMLRQICDTPVCIHFLGLIGSPKTHGYYGLLGAASSLLGIYQHWPVVCMDHIHTKTRMNNKIRSKSKLCLWLCQCWRYKQTDRIFIFVCIKNEGKISPSTHTISRQ